mmetsp:Transcript_36824/g.84844  ORF Transcript_36824/g.84844 Transcript_36824/m.84844 type:complete len:454 (-) Transcript_36824:11-1372(-)
MGTGHSCNSVRQACSRLAAPRQPELGVDGGFAPPRPPRESSGELASLARALAGGEAVTTQDVTSFEEAVAEWLIHEGYDEELARRLAVSGSMVQPIPEGEEVVGSPGDSSLFTSVQPQVLMPLIDPASSSSSSSSSGGMQVGRSTSGSSVNRTGPAAQNVPLLPDAPVYRRALERICPICMEKRESFEIAGCGHHICVRCAVTYVRVALGNAAEEVHAQGLHCPLNAIENCGALITPDTARVLLRASLLHAQQTSSFAGPLAEAELDRFDRFVVEATLPYGEKVHCPRCETVSLLQGETSHRQEVQCPYCAHRWNHSQRYGKDAATEKIIDGSSKPCPNCGLQITHYHGHGCHHIAPGNPGGCPRCHQHFCYVCLRKHGAPGVRRFHRRCTHTTSYCRSDRVQEHISLTPFPHDTRCGCPICPDCAPGKPCAQCHGTCVVCRGHVSCFATVAE